MLRGCEDSPFNANTTSPQEKGLLNGVIKETEHTGFWKVNEKILRERYKQKKISASMYIEGIVKLNEPGHPKTNTIKDFCKHWEIKRRTFYAALKNLPDDVHFEIPGNSPIAFWHGAETLQHPAAQNTLNMVKKGILPVSAQHGNKASNTENPVAQDETNNTECVPTSTENFVAQPVQSVAQPVQSVAHSTAETTIYGHSSPAKDSIKDNLKISQQKEREKKVFVEKKELVSGNSDSGERSKQLTNSLSTLAKKMSVPSSRKSRPQEQNSPARSDVSNDGKIVNSPNFCRWLESYKKAKGQKVKNGKAYVAVCLRNGGEGREDILDLYRKWQRLTVNLDGEQAEYLGYEVPDFTAPERGHDWHKKINDEWERLAQREVDFGRQLDFAIAKASEEMSKKYRWFGHWVNFVVKNYPSLKINPQPRNLNDTNASLNAREKIRAQLEAVRKKKKAERAANLERIARGE